MPGFVFGTIIGHLVGQKINGDTVHYLYDGQQAIAELRNGALSAAYHPGIELDEVLARYTDQGQKTLLQDALNSVIAQTDASQQATNWQAYSPYGETQSLGPDAGNPLQYTGRENDRTGLYYYRARYYDPVLKRFVSEDPIGLAGGINVYSYVLGDPISYTDPTGKVVPAVAGICAACPACCAAAAAATGAAIANICQSRPPGYWPGPKGAEEWGRQNGIGADEGRRRFHGVKQGDKGRPRDDYSVNPDTGDVVNPDGDSAGNLGD